MLPAAPSSVSGPSEPPGALNSVGVLAHDGGLLLPGLDPSGSGRLLDLAAAVAAVTVPLPEVAEPQRIALAGRVLDFEAGLLQSVPLIGARQLGLVNTAAATVDGSPSLANHNNASQQGGDSASFFRVGAWRTPWISQVSRMVDEQRHRRALLSHVYG